jgi:DNA-binding PadR family transcriptional regulator
MKGQSMGEAHGQRRTCDDSRMSIDPTRLLVLGATRQEQPASGYAIMRELIGWGVQDWASVNPGSIYGALRALDKEGLLIQDADEAPKSGRAYKNSTKYRLTTEGEAAFTGLLRSALREVDPYQTAPFMAALCFLVQLSRDEVATAIGERSARLENQLRQFEFDEKQKRLDDSKPPHSVEFVKLAAARLQGELTYTRALRERISAGDYAFTDEAPS